MSEAALELDKLDHAAILLLTIGVGLVVFPRRARVTVGIARSNLR